MDQTPDDELPSDRPHPGLCTDCGQWVLQTWEVEAQAIRLCLRHIAERVRLATWPHTPEME